MQQHIFVYGTLKTGQCRQEHWPHKPLQIRKAWTLGRLYETGPYPAMVRGQDRIAGQLWSFHASHLELTLSVLDQIEGTNQPGHLNAYDRSELKVHLDSGLSLVAMAYFYARHERLPHFTYLSPNLEIDGQLYAIWPPSSTW